MASNKQRIISTVLLLGILIRLIVPVPLHAQTISIEDYLLPGERVVTLAPGLMYNGHLYEIHYFTFGDFNHNSSSLIGLATPETFTQNQITGLLVTADDEIVEDLETLQKVFLLYRSAYYLYEVAAYDRPLGQTDYYPFEDFHRDLEKITENPIFIEQQFKSLFSSPEDEYADAFRGIITPQYETPTILQNFGSELQEGVQQGISLHKTVDLTLTAASYANNPLVHTNAQHVKEMLSTMINRPEAATIELAGRQIALVNALHIIDLVVRLAWMSDLQLERANWFEQYISFAEGDGLLTQEQLRAAQMVKSEAESNGAQRWAIAEDFVRDRSGALTVGLAKKEMVRIWMTWGAQESSSRLASFLISGAGTVTLAISLGNFMYGIDDLYNNFVIAERADELREKFYNQRVNLQESVRFSPLFYDAEIVEQFRVTYMLESLSAAQSFRSYSDGVEGTLNGGFGGILNPINWFQGKVLAEVVTTMRNLGDSVEIDATNTLGDPEVIGQAISLVWQRLSILSPSGTCAINSSDGVELHQEQSDEGDYFVVCVDLQNPYVRFQTMMANDVLNVNAVPDQRENVSNMVIRPPYELRQPIVAVNADYFGDGHGPEGFTVIDGERIDGPNNGDCDNPGFTDCQDNAIYRPSLSISRLNAIEISHKEVPEVENSLAQLSRFYNSVGGGPTLVADGQLIPDPCPAEGFSNFDECSQTRQTAVGVTEDGNTLIIIVADNKTGREIGQLLMKYGAYWGMKLGGGNSSQLWYQGDPKVEGTDVANAMVIFREEIPQHDAIILEQSQFPVLQAGEPFSVTIRLGNTGFLPWEKDLDYALQHVDGERFSIPSPRFLPATVPTGYDLSITLEGIAPSTPGAYQSIWQLVYQDSQGFIEPVSEELGFLVTVVPEGTSLDFTDSLQQFIDQFLAEIEGNVRDYLDELAQEIEARIAAELLKLIPPELQCLLGMGMIFSNGWFLTTWRRKRGQDE